MKRILYHLADFSQGRHRNLARRAYDEQCAAAATQRSSVGDGDFLKWLEKNRHRGGIRIGDYIMDTGREGQGATAPAMISLEDTYRHMLIQGGTGAGKSYLALSPILALPNYGIVDCKGEMFDLLLMHEGGKLYGLSDKEVETAVSQFIVIDPFGAEYLTPLNLIAPTASASVEQIATDIPNSLAHVSQNFSDRMKKILRMAVTVLAENGLSLLEVESLLYDPIFLNACLARTTDEDALRYFYNAAGREPEQTKSALISRLDEFFISKNIKLMLGAEETVDFREAMDGGKKILINLGKGPLNAGDLSAFLGNFFVKMIGNAIFSRQSRKPFEWILDEWQNLVDSQDQLERILTESRSFQVFLTFINQQVEQLDPKLRKILLNNVSRIFLMRSWHESAACFAHLLPATGQTPRVGSNPFDKQRFMSPDEERKYMVQDVLPNLPQRHMFLWDSQVPGRAKRCVAKEILAPHKRLGITEEKLCDFVNDIGLRRGACGKSITALKDAAQKKRGRMTQMFLQAAPIVVRSGSNNMGGQGVSANDTAPVNNHTPKKFRKRMPI